MVAYEQAWNHRRTHLEKQKLVPTPLLHTSLSLSFLQSSWEPRTRVQVFYSVDALRQQERGRGNWDRDGESNYVRVHYQGPAMSSRESLSCIQDASHSCPLKKDRELSPPPFIYPPAPGPHCLRDAPTSRSVNITHFLSAPPGLTTSSEHGEDPRQSAGRPTCSLAHCAAQGACVWNCPHSCSRFAGKAGDVTHGPKSHRAYPPDCPLWGGSIDFFQAQILV